MCSTFLVQSGEVTFGGQKKFTQFITVFTGLPPYVRQRGELQLQHHQGHATENENSRRSRDLDTRRTGPLELRCSTVSMSRHPHPGSSNLGHHSPMQHPLLVLASGPCRCHCADPAGHACTTRVGAGQPLPSDLGLLALPLNVKNKRKHQE